MPKYCFYPHPSSKNHGCEAIAVTSQNILKRCVPGAETLLLVKYPKGSEARGEALAYDIYDNELHTYIPTLKRYSPRWFAYQINKLFKKDISVNLLTKQMLRAHSELFEKYDVFVSIGGDNYCYGRPAGFYAMNRAAHAMGKKTVLWGCSVEPTAINEEMVSDLKLYDKIVARESITYTALCKNGVKNACLYPDPAFTLKPEKTDIFLENTVGINISPMILDYAHNAKKMMQAFKTLAEYILENTDCNIALIPHVTAAATNDIESLNALKAVFPGEARIRTIPDMNCQKLKSVIAQCRIFIGARTHATIAAYSSCVPTLVCGYSVKSKGIATDLFGTYDKFVVPVQQISDQNVLKDSFVWIMKNENSIRSHLQDIMPGYIEKSWEAGRELINEDQ